MLYTRYSNPLILLEQMIQARCLSEFIDKLYEKYNEDKMWELYLHTAAKQMSFDDFRRKLETPKAPETMGKERMTEIVRNSLDILSRQ